MKHVILRTMPALGLFSVGIGFLVYGLGYHTVPVGDNRQIEGDLASPLQPDRDNAPLSPGDQDASSFGGTPVAVLPSARMNKAIETVLVTEDTTEARLNREVSVGGVTLWETGEIRRTYTGKPPSLCPT